MHSQCGNTGRERNTHGYQDEHHREIATQLVPMNIERCLKKERREKPGENEILRQADSRRERQRS